MMKPLKELIRSYVYTLMDDFQLTPEEREYAIELLDTLHLNSDARPSSIAIKIICEACPAVKTQADVTKNFSKCTLRRIQL